MSTSARSPCRRETSPGPHGGGLRPRSRRGGLAGPRAPEGPWRAKGWRLRNQPCLRLTWAPARIAGMVLPPDHDRRLCDDVEPKSNVQAHMEDIAVLSIRPAITRRDVRGNRDL